MRWIDQLHIEHPFVGARMLRDLLRPEGFQAGRRHIGTLMVRMGIEAFDRKPNTARRQRGDEIHPSLLRGLAIERRNQAWAVDITYIPMRRGLLYLFAVIDWYSRRVLAWRLSNTLTTDFRLDAQAQHRSLDHNRQGSTDQSRCSVQTNGATSRKALAEARGSSSSGRRTLVRVKAFSKS